MSVLKSAELITTDTAAAIYDRHKVAGTREIIRHDVDVIEPPIRPATRTGSMLLRPGRSLTKNRLPSADDVLRPRHDYPRALGAAGSFVLRFGEQPEHLRELRDVVPRRDVRLGWLRRRGAGRHRLRFHKGSGTPVHSRRVARPDVAGYAPGREGIHPHKTLDPDPRIFITGWSEGGQRYGPPQADRGDLPGRVHDRRQFPVRRPRCATAMADLFCSYDEDYPESQIYYWVLRSMARVYKLKRSFDRIVIPPFAAALAEDVVADAPQNPCIGLDPEFRRSFLDGGDQEMRRALEDNDCYDWKPLAPVFLHHGTHDDIVPFFASQMAYEAMRARGAQVKLYPYLAKGPLPAGQHICGEVAGRLRRARLVTRLRGAPKPGPPPERSDVKGKRPLARSFPIRQTHSQVDFENNLSRNVRRRGYSGRSVVAFDLSYSRSGSRETVVRIGGI